YHELLFIIDTCQGASMYERFYSPNILALASSQIGEDSLSHQPDLAIGVHLMDRYTYYLLEFLEDIHPASQNNMNDLVSSLDAGVSSWIIPIKELALFSICLMINCVETGPLKKCGPDQRCG
ncbi:hypothetical protein chiPu_0024259, partial [Chiloscyllium punctatum]|nr:hypothetical protein [Chiloscyllium punctatum]